MLILGGRMLGREAIVTALTAPRALIALAGLGTLLLIEQWAPFRRPVERPWRRRLRNVTIAGGNALGISALFGGLLLAVYHALELRRVGLLHRLGVAAWINVVASVILLDGFTYAWHRAYHQWPWLWRLHRVHHSDLDLDVTTSGRFHLFEMGLSALVRLGAIAVIGADSASVLLFEIIFGCSNQLEHANLHLPSRLEAWLRQILVTPDMHRIHHGQEVAQTNSNYSTIFSWWDRLFATYREASSQEPLVIGLPDYPQPRHVRLGHVLAMPFDPPCHTAAELAAAAAR